MGSVKTIFVGSACLLASTFAWAQPYTGDVGGTFDSPTGAGSFNGAWIANTSSVYGGNIVLNRPWNVSVTSAIAGTPGNVGGVYYAGAWLVPNYIVSNGSSTTRYSLGWTYGGLDSKGQIIFNLNNAVALNLAGNTNSAGCKPGFPTTAGQTWQATYSTVNSSGQTGTKQMTWMNQGSTIFNNLPVVAVQETEADATGTRQRIVYYQPSFFGVWVKVGESIPATPTAPQIQTVFSPPPTVFANNLNAGSSIFYYYTETKTVGSTISTLTKISALTFAGVKSVSTPAGPFAVCAFRSMWAENGQPSSVIDALYDAVTGGLVERDRNGSPVDVGISLKF